MLEAVRYLSSSLNMNFVHCFFTKKKISFTCFNLTKFGKLGNNNKRLDKKLTNEHDTVFNKVIHTENRRRSWDFKSLGLDTSRTNRVFFFFFKYTTYLAPAVLGLPHSGAYTFVLFFHDLFMSLSWRLWVRWGSELPPPRVTSREISFNTFFFLKKNFF